MGTKFLAKVAAFGLVVGLLCSGCGTGVTLLPMASPMISQVSPQTVTAGTQNVTVTVQGANFLAQSALTVNGTVVPTTVVNSTTLAAKIGGNTLAQPAVAQLQVQNSDGVRSNQVPFTVAAAQQQGPPPLTIANTQLPAAQVGTAYNQPLTVTGGTPGYTWAVSSGSLPAGLTLSSGGVLSGAPTASGNSTFTVTVSDSGTPQLTSTLTFSIAVTPVTVAPVTLTIGSVALGSAQVGVTYSHTLNASGGTPNYAWAISSGKLPAGLNLSSAGVISGTPTASGTATFTVSVQDSGSPVQTATAQASITVAAPGLAITTTNLAAGKNGTAYSAILSASGGTPNFTWSISSGSLPAGLSLSSAGVISGTPTASGTATFTVAVQDNGSPVQTATAQESIAVAAAPSTLTITSTSLGATQTGGSYSTTLSATGGTPGYTWSLASGSLPAGLTLSSAGVISGTPTTSGTATFTVAVKDSGSPAQTASAQESITVAATPLTITSTNLAAGTDGGLYNATLSATGGTPSYSWSVTAGNLPAGLTLSSAGVISGTPTASGTATFTVGVSDSASPVATATAQESITINAASPGTTWFVRPDGGTRYSGNVQNGQCDGQADVPYPGSGVNQHCAFNDVRYMWMDGTYGNSQWAMSGGDTLVIRGCAALPSQQNPDAPHCRIGWDKGTGNDSENFWCAGVNAWWGCSMPPPPNGTATQHTRILGGCAYGTYSCNPVSGYPYTSNNLTQLFGGFGVGYVLLVNGASYVDIEGLEITSHNGACTRYGIPAYPAGCGIYPDPASDFANVGIGWNNTSTNISLQDVYIHGFTGHGMYGSTGAGISLNRVSMDFNVFAGWNFDDGVGFASNATLTQSYVSMVGNGCLEEYPIVDPQFPAKACWDDGTAGFGDSWSAGNGSMSTFTCDHCLVAYNLKDGMLGPHTAVSNMSLTNSIWIGNEGQAWKMSQPTNSTGLFQNNLLLTNCYRYAAAAYQSQPIPGSSSSLASHLYIGDPCRASNTAFAYNADAGSTVNFVNNTIVTYQATIFEVGCWTAGNCASVNYNFTNNLILGYTNNYSDVPGFAPGSAPGLYYNNDTGTINFVGSHNLEYGIRNGDTCGSNGNICNDPKLLNEPAQGTVAPSEAALDVFSANLANSSFNLTSGSTFAIGQGISNAYTPSADANGNPQTSPVTIGAVVQQ